MDGISKFDQLRSKTDRELLRIFNDDLDCAVRAASDAGKFAGDPNAARVNSFKARRAFAEVSRLLPLAYGISESERAGLESRLNRLRCLLETLPNLESQHQDSPEFALAGAH